MQTFDKNDSKPLQIDQANKIMIVDDAVFNLITIKLMLEKTFKLNKSVFDHTANNGKEAVDRVRADIEKFGYNTYKLILMDC